MDRRVGGEALCTRGRSPGNLNDGCRRSGRVGEAASAQPVLSRCSGFASVSVPSRRHRTINHNSASDRRSQRRWIPTQWLVARSIRGSAFLHGGRTGRGRSRPVHRTSGGGPRRCCSCGSGGGGCGQRDRRSRSGERGRDPARRGCGFWDSGDAGISRPSLVPPGPRAGGHSRGTPMVPSPARPVKLD
jgi:hypothetical protein